MAYHSGITLVILLISVWVSVQERTKKDEFFLKPDVFNSINVESTTKRLRAMMQTACLKDRISITFRRDTMLSLGILPNQLMLDEVSEKCSFISNETHYAVEILFGGLTCGSRYERHDPKIGDTVDNTVSFFPNVNPEDLLTRYLLTESDDEDDFELVSGSGDGVADAPDELHVIRIPFQCVYNLAYASTSEGPLSTKRSPRSERTTPANIPMRVKFSSSSFVMELFDRRVFVTPLRPSLLTVPAETLLFAQVKPNGSSNYDKSFLHNCYYHSKLGTADYGEVIYFIRNGCPVDPSVEFIENSRGGGERLFKFRVRKIYKRYTFIRCELQPCSLMGSRSSLPECGSQMAYCNSRPYMKRNLNIVNLPYPILVSDPPLTRQRVMDARPVYKGCAEQSVEEACECERMASGPSSERVRTHGSEDERAVDVWVAIAISIAAFIIGASSVVLLWFLHNRMDPRRKMQAIPANEPDSHSRSIGFLYKSSLIQERGLQPRML